MAIGSPDKAARLDQLRTYARVQVWSGYQRDEDVRSDVYDAVLDEVKDAKEAAVLTDRFLDDARAALAQAATRWPPLSAFDRLQAAFADLRSAGVVVLEAVDDHWVAQETLELAAERGRRPLGIVYFTPADVWHAVEHSMLELNVWHGTSANVAPGDGLLELVTGTLGRHGIESLFDEGRVEVSVAWERRPARVSTAADLAL
ncbi:MAG: hypothetical protein H0U36_03985 [Nocardioidaceae bacterium]|nr:hypothetical protein [Nocardioidaceae bacterium]